MKRIWSKPEDRSEYQAPYRLVLHVATWVWPHDSVVYPVQKRVPRKGNGRKQLLSVLRYLEARANQDFMSQSEG